MEIIPLVGTTHTFEKNNLITQTSGGRTYDTYGCKYCDLVGRRHGLSEFIEVTANKICTNVIENVYTDRIVQLNINKNTATSFGLVDKSYMLRVPCPTEEVEKYSDDTWVLSPKLNEPVRLLYREYNFVDKPLKWFNERIGKEVIFENIKTGALSEYKIGDNEFAKTLFHSQYIDDGYIVE